MGRDGHRALQKGRFVKYFTKRMPDSAACDASIGRSSSII